MIVLTPRLSEIALNIEKRERVADIGTDHGYLGLYLLENNLCSKVVLTDISDGSLKKAKANGDRLFENREIDYRLGDGLEPLSRGEVDTAVIAGIGGLLSINILDWDISKTLSFKKYIFQPRNNGGELRRYLYEQGFSVDRLSLVMEDRRICEVMTASPPIEYKGRKESHGISQENFDFPDELITIGDNLTKEYLEKALKLEEDIINNIKAGLSHEKIETDRDIKYRESRVNRINSLLKRVS